jgi:lysophospholipase L1-like esterase
VLSAGAVVAVIVSLAGYIGVAARGFPARFPDFSEQRIAGHEVWKAGSCFLTGNPDYRRWSLNECTRIATGPRKVLLWGDSFAAQYVPGVILNAKLLNLTAIQYTAAGCPPVLSYTSYARSLCASFNAHALDIIDAEGIDTVIISGRWTDMKQRGLGEISSTLRALDQRRIAVFVVGQSPEFVEDVQVIDFLKGDKSPDAVNRWGVFFGPELNSEILAIVGAGRFIDPMPPLCDGSVCTYKDRGVFLFEDYGHFSAEGSRRVVSKLFVGKKDL